MKNKLFTALKKTFVYKHFGKIKQGFEFAAAVIAIGGWVLVVFTFGQSLMPGTELKAFADKVSDLRLGQGYAFIEKKLGIPTTVENIEYPTFRQTDERGSVATYFSNDYIVRTYFDSNHSLFGYVVVSDSKYFHPRIPSTLNTAKDGLQRLKRLSFKDVHPSNYSYEEWVASLDHQYIFARSGSPDLEKYYVEIYNMLNNGYLGVALTDINRESKSMANIFKGLSDITNTVESNAFYRQYKDYFENHLFHTRFSEKAEEIKNAVYSLTKIDNQAINSYFLFSTISEVNASAFLENQLKDHYFISKQNILQLK